MSRRSSIVLAACMLACTGPARLEPPPIEPDPAPPADAGPAPELDAAPEPEPEALPPIELRADVPPISGGTMVVTSSGLAVAGDELTDQLWVLDLESWTLLGGIDLGSGVMPGRAVEDEDGLVHVITRRGGELVGVDPRELRVVSRRAACPAPRGLAFDGGLLHVACAGGELVSFAPDGGAPVRSLELEPDLRDVVALGDRLYVSRFRSAELLVLDASGSVVARGRPLSRTFPLIDPPVETRPNVAWRLLTSGDRIFMVHQQSISSDLGAITSTGSGATYYIPGGFGGQRPSRIVEPHLTTFDADAQALETRALPDGVVVDGVISELGFMPARPEHDGQVAIAHLSDGSVLTFVQDPRLLFGRFWPHTRVRWAITRPRTLVMNRGREAFHRITRAGVACASCHPGAHEDGHVWQAADTGPRRSQSLLGGLRGTEPFHWNGDLASFDHVMDAQALRLLTEFSAEEREAMLDWLDAQPAVPGGEALPEDRAAFEAAGCGSCHAGDALSDELNHDVGAGSFQTPRLKGVLLRAPYFFEGCATTLEATLDGSCRPMEQHGVASAEERARIVGYLRAL